MGDKPHKQLIVWQRAVDFIETIYKLTEQFPKEEQFGQARILLETWKAFGAGIHTPGYHVVAPGGSGAGMGLAWGDVQNAYFGRSQTPYFIFGAYAPSNDWTLWSNVQLE